MDTQKCNVFGCDNDLSTVAAYKFNICQGHYELAIDEEYFVGVCWLCQTITHVQHRRLKRDVKVKDKYVFAKGCKRCGSPRDAISWMTIKSNQLSVWAVDELGVIKEETFSINNSGKLSQNASLAIGQVGEDPMP